MNIKTLFTLGLVLIYGLVMIFTDKPGNVSPIPEDIIKKVEELFPEQKDRQEVMEILRKIMSKKHLGVGHDQLIRSMLIISGNDKEKLHKIYDSNFYGDPRDVIMEAMKIPGNTNDHGMTPFE